VAVYDGIDGQRWLLMVAVRTPLNSSCLLSGKEDREEDINFFVTACSVSAPVTVGGLWLDTVGGVWCRISPADPRPATGRPESDVLIDFDINDAVDVWGGAAYSI